MLRYQILRKIRRDAYTMKYFILVKYDVQKEFQPFRYLTEIPNRGRK